MTVNFNVVTLLPEIFAALDYGIVGRARKQGIISYSFWNPRDYASGSYRKVDDASYGGGSGMVMMVQPLRRAITAARQAAGVGQLIYLTPQGRQLTDGLVKELATHENLFLVAGRYEGIDERLLALEPGLEISIGDYVLSGGEIPAMVLIDAVTRQLPGSVGKLEAVVNDSFYHGLLDYPHYTRPQVVEGLAVPKILLSGNQREIERWRKKQILGRTWLKRPDLLDKIELTASDIMLLNEFIEELL